MNSKKTTLIFLILFQIFIVSCSKCKNNNGMIGKYETEIKGIEIRDSLIGKTALDFLKIDSNSTFKLYDVNGENNLNGTWRIISCQTVENNLGERVPESILEFEIESQKTKAKYRDGRLTFQYPNDFYQGRYKTLWYVKLNDE